MPRIRVFRIAALLTALLFALLLFRWSRSADPRFYRFLETPAGRFLAGVFRWYASPPVVAEDDKPESEMTAEEIAVKRALEKEAGENIPRQMLVLQGGKTMRGKLLEERPDHVVFLESYGESGSLSVKVVRSRIVRIEEISASIPRITYRDVRFKVEFPKMNLYRRPPYTVMTDETFFHVEQSVRVLQNLHRDFVNTFGPLFTRSRTNENIQIVFFSDEASFRQHQQAYAPHMEGVLGFYSPQLDRFMVFNEKRSDQLADLTRTIDEQAGEIAAEAASEKDAERVRMLKRQIQRGIEHSAEKRTYTTIRHEGAHQLFFTYGVHSSHRVENEWLVEGLAVYCETLRPGDKEPGRVEMLKKRLAKGELMPLGKLILFRNAKGFSALGNLARVDLAYDQSWALVRCLLEPARRNGFFEYIRYIRDPRHLDSVMRQSRVALLCRFLDTTPDQLEADWKAYVQQL